MKKILLFWGIIILLAIGITGCKTNETAQPDNQFEYELNEEGIIKPEHAKIIIQDDAAKLIKAISAKDTNTIAEFVHPLKGVRFTPYTFVSIEQDIVFKEDKIRGFFKDQNVYLWGHYDGTGEEIRLTPEQYYEKFIYPADFQIAKDIGYNEVLSFGNMLENQFEVYENPIVVEYYLPGTNPNYGGLDWRSLRLVFEQYDNKWKLVGIINNQWTI